MYSFSVGVLTCCFNFPMRKITMIFVDFILIDIQCDRKDYTISLMYFASVITLQNQDLPSNSSVLYKLDTYSDGQKSNRLPYFIL